MLIFRIFLANNASSKDVFDPESPRTITNSKNYYVLQPDPSIFLDCNCSKQTTTPPRPSTPSFLTALPDLTKLLRDYWPIYIILPNQKVYKQLINFSVPVQDSLQLLLNCFEHSYTSPGSFLIVQVVGELYQTYRTLKYSLFDCRKRIQFIDWKKSFFIQGVQTSKIIRITFRVGVSARLDSDRLSEFLYTVNNLSDTELFYMNCVCFVKGIFPIRDESVSRTLTACVYLIHKKISGTKYIDATKFIPSHFRGVSSHFRSIQTEAESMTTSGRVYDTFMETLNKYPSGNAISFPIVIIKKYSDSLQHINCVFMVSGNHIGVSELENEVDFSKSDANNKFWHFSDILGWFVQPADDVVFIQLDKSIESSANLIFLSPNSDFIDCLFSQFLGIK